MMNIVIDTSALLSILANESKREQMVACTRGCTLIAPQSIDWEVGNALSKMYRMDRFTEAQLFALMADYRATPIKKAPIMLEESVKIAFEHRIYAYDAYFLTCAISHRAPLLSLDKALNRVAEQMNISLWRSNA